MSSSSLRCSSNHRTAAICLGFILLGTWAALGQEEPDAVLTEIRQRLREVTGNLYVAPDLWGGPVDPENIRKFEEFFERARAEERPLLIKDMAALAPKVFAGLFDKGFIGTLSDDELHLVYRSVMVRGRAPGLAMTMLKETANDAKRPLRLRIVAACAGARLGTRSLVPILLLGARASNEIAVITDKLRSARRTAGADEDRRLARFDKSWRTALHDITETLKRLTRGEDLPEMELGNWGAVARWEKWGKGLYGPRPAEAQIKSCYGGLIWYSRAPVEGDVPGEHVSSIFMEALAEYIRAQGPKSEPERLLADTVGATYQLRSDGEKKHLAVHVGNTLYHYTYDRDTESWRCTEKRTLIEGNSTLMLR